MSRRSKKRVDYSQFGIQDEDDDDFAEFTPPASKRIKTSTSKTDAKSKEPKTNKPKEGRGDRKSLNRSAPSDEAFESELQLALEMSRSESQEVKEESPLLESNKENQLQVEMEDEKAEENHDVSSSAGMIPDTASNICDINSEKNNLCKPATVINKSDDEIEVLATDVIEDVKPRRSSATKKIKNQEESDFEDDMEDISSYDEDDDDDDSYDGEDSDFDDCKKKNKSKAKKSVKSSTATKAKAATVKAPKPASSKQASKSTVSKPSVKPSGSKTPSTQTAKSLVPRPSPVRRPALSSPSTRWNPPGPAKQKDSDATSVQSPTSGLRLGLSRNMKLKPLHPNLKVQH